jgi:hypothetical protein
LSSSSTLVNKTSLHTSFDSSFERLFSAGQNWIVVLFRKFGCGSNFLRDILKIDAWIVVHTWFIQIWPTNH